jgi:hypothetical protein
MAEQCILESAPRAREDYITDAAGLSSVPDGSNGEGGLPPDQVRGIARGEGRALRLELFRPGVHLNRMSTNPSLSLAHDATALEAF